LLLVLLPWSPARAAGQDLWRRPDQQTHQRMQQGADAYRKNDFVAAEKAWKPIATADGHYNLGNALAKAGHYPEAIAAYDRALRAQPGMADALANKRAVEAAMKRKSPPGKQDKGGKQDPGNNSKKDSKPQPGDKGESSDGSDSKTPPSQPKSQQDQASQQPQGSQPDKPQDAAAQKAADAAQRERMQRALAQQGAKKPDEKAQQAQVRNETPAERERRQANEAWLRRVPDDPGGLLRAKFRLEQERRQQSGSSP
jgi:Ca-activated chloride channel family protein